MAPLLLHDLLSLPQGDLTRPAVVDGARQWSFLALKNAVDAYASALLGAGIRRGDRVGILLPKCLEECAAIFAASQADAVFVPINPVLKPAQIRHILADSGARALITGETQLSMLGDALEGLEDLAILRADQIPLDTPVPALPVEPFLVRSTMPLVGPARSLCPNSPAPVDPLHPGKTPARCTSP